MAWLVRHLPLRHEDQSSNPQNPEKSPLSRRPICNPRAQETETGEVLKASSIARSAKHFNFRERFYLNIQSGKSLRKTTSISLRPPHAHTHTRVPTTLMKTNTSIYNASSSSSQRKNPLLAQSCFFLFIISDAGL